MAFLLRAISRFLRDPWAALSDMRAVTPGLQAACLALALCSLVMAIIDLAYGPYAYPHSVAPGGKRAGSWFGVAAVEVLRGFGVASVLLLGTRHLLKSDTRVSEAIWMTVPYAAALIAFELLQMSTWVAFRLTGLNMYGAFFMIGFVGCILVLILSIRVLAPDRDWLAVLPVAALGFGLGTFFTPLVLLVTGVYLAVRWLDGGSSLDRG